jgi:hypothetical protein
MFTSSATRWGIIVGLINLGWLYGSFYMGMHNGDTQAMQTVVLVAAILNLAGYVLALGMETRHRGPMTYGVGFKFGLGVTAINALMAGLGQVGYFKVVNPGWPEFMIEKYRELVESGAIPEDQAEGMIAQVSDYFTLKSHLIQAVSMTMMMGVILSAVLMLILRQKKPKLQKLA